MCSYEEHSVRMKNTLYPRPLTTAQCKRHHALVQLVIESSGHRCMMCGADKSDICPYRHVRVTLTAGFVAQPQTRGQIVRENLMPLCCTCANGLKSLQKYGASHSDSVSLKSQILEEYPSPKIPQKLSTSRPGEAAFE